MMRAFLTALLRRRWLGGRSPARGPGAGRPPSQGARASVDPDRELEHVDAWLARHRVEAVCFEAGGSAGLVPRLPSHAEARSTSDRALDGQREDTGFYAL